MRKVLKPLLYDFKSTYINVSRHFKKVSLPPQLEPGVYPFPKRQVPKDGTRTWEDRVKEIYDVKHKHLEPINIGFSEKQEYKMKHSNDTDFNLESIHDEYFQSKEAVNNKFKIATRLNIYSDLFTYPHFFYPVKAFNVIFEIDEDNYIKVHNGNLLSPKLAKQAPVITGIAGDSSLYTLVMSCPDENLGNHRREYVHWIVTNMKMGDDLVYKGEIVIPYMQPIPYLGTGFHRYVFTLYKQENGKVDLLKYKIDEKCAELSQRDFSSFDFLSNFQDEMTPIGLSFFQAAYDDTVRNVFRNVLDCEEPIFEFHRDNYLPKPQNKFPLEEEVHTYYDQYRDTKDIAEEVLKERLKSVDPFKTGMDIPYPLALPSEYTEENHGNWVGIREREKRNRQGQWRNLDIQEDSVV